MGSVARVAWCAREPLTPDAHPRAVWRMQVDPTKSQCSKEQGSLWVAWGMGVVPWERRWGVLILHQHGACRRRQAEVACL